MPDLVLGSTTVMSDSTGSVKFTDSVLDNSTFPAGHVIQVKGNRSNYNWGSIGHNNSFDITWCQVSMTAKGTGSNFYITGQFSTDDVTSSESYGVGLGIKYTINGGSENIAIHPAQHEDYEAAIGDQYKVARMRRLIHNDTTMTDSTSAIVPTSGLINATAGDTIVWIMTGRFNNSNGQYFMGNSQSNAQPYFNSELIVMEISA